MDFADALHLAGARGMEARRGRVPLEQPMDGLGFATGRFAQALGGATGGRAQHHVVTCGVSKIPCISLRR